jgi:hypothetical protein
MEPVGSIERLSGITSKFFDVSFLVKRFLMLYLILLPFQMIPNFLSLEESIITKIISNIDELTTLSMFFILLTFIALKPRVYRFRYDAMPTRLLLLFLFVACLSILWNSMLWNRLYILQGFFSTYNFLKNIIVVCFFATLKWDKNDLKFLIKGIAITVLILAIAGIIGEILALTGKDSLNLVITEESKTRFGFYRVQSLTGEGSTNYLAMYGVLGFFLVDFAFKYSISRKLGKFIVFLLIIFTFSKRGLLSLFFMVLLIRKKIKSLWLFSLLIIGVFGLYIIFLILETSDIVDPEHYMRAYGYLKSFELFIQHPILGIGPGMFGDLGSIIFGSPYYSDISTFMYDKIAERGGIDSFWPLILSQTGILGFLLFGAIFTSFYLKIERIANKFKILDNELYKLGRVLAAYIIVLILMALGSNLNKPFVTYTFFGMYGIYMSLFFQFSKLEIFKGKNEK